MTLDTQRLLLAAELRNIASDLRNAAAQKAVPVAGDARAELNARNAWKAARPLATFIPDALAELQAIDKLISR